MNKSHLLRFKVKNFRSFNSEQEISFQDKQDVRSVTAFFGPNASGKSNIVKGLQFVRGYILNSNDPNLINIPVEQFLLNTVSRRKPSEFELEFIQDKRHFIYGFSVDRKEVKYEYLKEFASETLKPRTIFKRTQAGLNPTAEKYKFGKKLFADTRSNTLLITKARQNNNEYSNILFKWLSCVNFLSGDPTETMQWTIDQLRTNPDMVREVTELLGEADLWIKSFTVEDVSIPAELVKQLPFNEEFKNNLKSNMGFAVRTMHVVRDSRQRVVGEEAFQLDHHESAGTRRFFELAAPIIDTLANGKVLYIDEFGAYLHPDMCKFIVAMFKSARNKNGAQLIINTHDTILMHDLLEREDIFFVEKSYLEESVVRPLSTKSVRLGEKFEKRYREGFYGAKPQIEQE